MSKKLKITIAGTQVFFMADNYGTNPDNEKMLIARDLLTNFERKFKEVERKLKNLNLSTQDKIDLNRSFYKLENSIHFIKRNSYQHLFIVKRVDDGLTELQKKRNKAARKPLFSIRYSGYKKDLQKLEFEEYLKQLSPVGRKLVLDRKNSALMDEVA